MLDQRVLMDPWGHLESSDTPSDPREPPDTQVFPGFQDRRDPRHRQVTTAKEESKALKGSPARRGQWECPVHLEAE